MKRGKLYQEALKLVDTNKEYEAKYNLFRIKLKIKIIINFFIKH